MNVEEFRKKYNTNQQKAVSNVSEFRQKYSSSTQQNNTNNSKSIDTTKTPAYNLLKNNTNQHAVSALQTLNKASNVQSYNNIEKADNYSKNNIDISNNKMSAAQMSATPTFKTLEEAKAYAKNNNLNVYNWPSENQEKISENKFKLENAGMNISLNEEDRDYYLDNLQKFKTSARINENSYKLAKERYENAPEEEKEDAFQKMKKAEEIYKERLLDYNTALAYESMTTNKMELFGRNIMGNIAQSTANILNTANRNFDNNTNALKGTGVQNIDAQKLYEYSKNPNDPQAKINAMMSLTALSKQNTDSSKKLLEEISNGTFNGNVQDIEKIINDSQIEYYNENKLLKNTYNYMQNVNESAQNIGLNDGERIVYNATGVVAGQVPTMAMTMINPVLGDYGIYANAGQSAFDEALKNGATYKQAESNAMLSGVTELGVEKVSGGLSNKLLGSKALVNPGDLTKRIGNKFVKGTVDTILDVTGEGLEEVAVTAIQPWIDRITYNPNAQLASGEELWNSFTESILPTLLMQGIGATTNGINNYHDTQIKQIQNSNLSQEQKTNLINKTTEQRDKLLNEMEKSQKPVENVTPQSSNNQVQQQTNEVISQQIENQNNSNMANNSLLRQSVNKVQEQGFKIPENTITTLENIQNKRQGLNIEFDTSVNGNGMYTVNNDGTRTIKINPNSARAIEFTVVHELGHDLKTGDSKSYNDLKNFVLEYSKTKEGYETAIKALGETYSKQLGKENFVLDDEATNDILGEAIGNQEFLNSLAQKQPNLFQRIYNWLKNVLFDGNNTGRTLEERRFLNSLQSKFATAYNQSFNNTGNNQINYSIGGRVGMQNAINNDSRFTRLENNLNRAQTMATQGVDNEYIRQQTNWFQDKNGDWKFEFSDKDMSLKKGIVLEENKTYKLGDILEHDTLFFMYPKLRNYNINFVKQNNTKKKGKHDADTRTISINSKMMEHSNWQELVEGTLIHEIQHAIQNVEGFEKGKSSFSKLAYYNSLGEIEANETKKRFIKEKYNKRDMSNIPPESSKMNPQRKELSTYLQNRTPIDKIKDKIYNSIEDYIKKKGDSYEEYFQEDTKKDIYDDRKDVYVGRRVKDYKNRGVINGSISKETQEGNNTNLVQADGNIVGKQGTLKNSNKGSFSLPENNWQIFLDDNFDLNPNSTKTKAVEIKKEEKASNKRGIDNSQKTDTYTKTGATVTTKKHEVSKINNFINKVLTNMETTRFGNTKELKNITKGIIKDIRADNLSENKLNQYANVIYDAANRIDTQYYEDNKELKNNIRNTKLYISPKIRSGIVDWNDFRKNNFGILSLSDDKTSLPVDTFYNELSKERTDLFPENIINEIDQLERISEVAKSIRKIEQKASEYLENNYGKEVRDASIEEIKKDINRLSEEIKQVQKVELENIKKDIEKESLISLGNELTVEEIKELHKQNKHLKKDYEKAYRKELLTEKDKKHLERLVKGEITLDEISGTSNKEAIKRLYKYKKPLEDNNNKILQAKKAKKAVRFEMAEEAVKNSGTWKDKKVLGGLRYSTEIAERNIYDIIPDRTEAKNVIDTYFKPVHVHEAQATRKKNEIIEKVKKLNIDTKEKYQISESIRNKINEQLPPGEVYKENMLSESSLVQLLGEKVINIKDIQELGADVSKIENATNVFRDIYNELFELSNDALISNGYNPVEYRKDYFPHFSEEKPDSTIKKIANKLGIETSNKELPTDLAGLTQTFKPGKKWVGNFLERKGKVTDYNALKGLDTYLGPVMDVIYHTDDIQNLRALEDSIRYKYSSKGVQEQIDETRDRLDLDDIQKNAILNDLYNTDTTDFSHFVTWLRGYTDNLSGKKSIEDRNMEHKLGRAAYNTMKNVEGRVASNMIGANINSALTNFIPIVQGWGEVSSGSMTKAMWDTARNAAKADGLTDTSDFLVNRRGNDKLYKTTTDKISEKAGILMRTIDEFTSETLVRAKYYDNIKAGMSQEDAMSNANEFGASIMGDRSKGAMPTIYNEKNPITKTFTMFQLEVNNQYRYWLKDLPKNVKDEVGNSLAKALFKIFLGSWIYGELKEKITGTRSVTDPIDIVADTFKDVLSEDIGAGQTIMNLGNRIIDELPFINTLTGGGRIPISSAFPDIENTLKATTGLTTGEMDSKKAGLTLLKELSKPAYYFLLPTAGGQVKKAIEGISAVANGGEYGIDAEGNKKLKFPIDTSNMNALEKLGTYAKAATFGKYSLPTAKDYVDSGYKQLSAKKTQGYQEAIKKGISADTYLSVEKQIRNVKPDGEKFVNNERRTKIINIIESQDLTKEQKEYLYKVFYKNEI